jgi:16S rRNA processing protein rimM
MKEIEIGKIVTAVGIKGEVKFYSFSDDPMKLAELEYIYIGKNKTKYDVEKVRSPKGNTAALKLIGIDTRNDAELLKDKLCYIDESMLSDLGEGEYYIKDLIGLEVFDEKDNSLVGVLEDVIQNTAQDIYLIKTKDGSEVLVPAVKEFIKDIDIETGRICINFIEGMR